MRANDEQQLDLTTVMIHFLIEGTRGRILPVSSDQTKTISSRTRDTLSAQ